MRGKGERKMKKALALLIVAIIVCQGFAVLAPTARAQASTGSAPEVVCVPFHGTLLGVPHDAWIGKEIILKGTAHDPDGDNTLAAYKWDFGDGYSTDWIAGVNPYVIEAKHTYTGTMADGTPYSEGKFFTAWLYVKDNDENVGKDSYYTAIRDVSTPEKKLPIEVNVAIDNGLWWLHKQQSRGAYGDGTEYGYWVSSSGYHVSFTAASTEAFELQGHLPSGDRSEDPYVETVQRGLNYLFNQFYTYSISQDATYCPLGNPDVNDNGIGLACFSGGISQQIYESGMALMAISSSGSPNRIAATGSPNVVGRTYKDIVQDMVDFMAWGQSDPYTGVFEGGWRYYANYGQSDNSVSQWPVIGMEAAERNFGTSGVTVPSFVRPELLKWLTYSQGSDGGFGYQGPGSWENTAKTGAGCAMLYWTGVPATDTKFQNALSFLNAHWYDSASSYTNFGDYYTMYAIMKGMRIPHPNVESIGTHDWYAEYARYIVDQQNSYGGEYVVDHSWLGSVVDGTLATAWAIAILTPTLVKPGPVADAGPDVSNFPPTIPVKFDASGSYHRDPTKSIALYEWDFDSDGTWDYSGTDVKVEHAYPAYKTDDSIDWDKTAKDYTATLRVTDNSDPALEDTDTCVVHITPPPWKPVADPNGPYKGFTGISIQLDGSKSYDPESKMYPQGHPWYETIAKYEWDLDNDGQFDDSLAVEPSYKWDTKGTYSVGLRVTDSQPSGLGGTIGPLDVDMKYTTVVISAPTHKIAYIPVKYSDDSHNPTQTVEELKQRAQLVTEYYEQQSYGTVGIGSAFIFDDWESLGRSWDSYDTNHNGQIDIDRNILNLFTSEADNIRNDAIDVAESKEEFDIGDYDAVIVIQPDGEITSYTNTLGGKEILTSDRRIYATWAHELGHSSICSFDDYYGSSTSKGDINYWGLMGSATLMNPTAPIMSYNKEKAGWLQYHTIMPGEYGDYTVELLKDLEFKDEVQRYQTKKGSVKYYIFEGRNPPDEIKEDPWSNYPEWSDYDYELEKVEGVLLYQVEPKGFIITSDYVYSVPPYQTANNNKVTLNSDNPDYQDTEAGVKFSMYKQDSILKLKISAYKPKNKVMMSLSNIVLTTPDLGLEPIPLESHFDVDLHAYSYNGQHVGIMYSTMQYECQINGAEFRSISGGGSEYIALPANVNSYFVVDATLAKKWADEHPLLTPNDLEITADVMLTYFDDQGNRYESSTISQKIMPGEKTQYCYEIVQNPDGTYTPKIAPISWEYIFEDPTRQTVLKISTDDKYFQFIAPDKDFLVKQDPQMKVLKRAIVILFKDWEIRIFTIAVDTKLDFCYAMAWDMQTHKCYLLIDKPGIEK